MRIGTGLKTTATLVLFISACSQVHSRKVTILGVVQEVQENVEPRDVWRTNLRLGFTRDAAGWEPICSLAPDAAINEGCRFAEPDQERTWRVLYSGGQVGTVSTAGWFDSSRYSATGLLRIVTPAPRIGTRSDEFSGWATDSAYRPLVAILGDGPRPTAQWTSRAGADSDLEVVWPAFRELVPRIPSCGHSEGDPAGAALLLQPDHVEVFRVLESDTGARLSGVHVKPHLGENCFEQGGFTSDVWYFTPPHAGPRVLDGFPPNADDWPFSLVPVDIGDFDGDGGIEIVFWYSGYNEDGYVLFYDDFSKHARFTWAYH